ncbi:hypothetical protein JTB14_026621 [Gonioctena quinquepunctata]|nr:hypothetical protein JTB14_026621 [Gonioctena quinquepunctata]
MSNLEDISVTTMISGEFFSTLDIRKACLYMPMDDESAEIQAIATTKGDYKKITYLVHTISDRGLEKTPEKIKAVGNARVPTNVSEPKNWLGLVNYYSKFLRNLAVNLLQRNVQFQWTEHCQYAFDLMKVEITSNEIICAHDSNLPLLLATDATPYALGAVLSHMPDGT